MDQEKMEETESAQSSETDKYNENISSLTAVIDISVVKSLSFANVNRQLQYLITQCEAISKLTNDAVLKHQPMSSSISNNQQQIGITSEAWKIS